jgi:hypothetical protein
VRLINPSARDIREMASPVVRVNVQASEIAHCGQIQITIAIEIHKRRVIDTRRRKSSERAVGAVQRFSSPVANDSKIAALIKHATQQIDNEQVRPRFL